MLKSFNIKGWCWYEVYGDYDNILRVWTPAALGMTLKSKLLNVLYDANVRDIKELHIIKNPIHWLWFSDGENNIDSTSLKNLTIDSILKVQTGSATDELLNNLLSGGLLKGYTPTNGIKFFGGSRGHWCKRANIGRSMERLRR